MTTSVWFYLVIIRNCCRWLFLWTRKAAIIVCTNLQHYPSPIYLYICIFFYESQLETLEDDRMVLYKTKSLDGTKSNTNAKTNPWLVCASSMASMCRVSSLSKNENNTESSVETAAAASPHCYVNTKLLLLAEWLKITSWLLDKFKCCCKYCSTL